MKRETAPTVVAVCGSFRENSRTRIVLNESLAATRAAGGQTELIDLQAYDLPNLNSVESEPAAATEFKETIEGADSVLLGTPNYHGSYSGSLKNALDYCGREEFSGTTVGLVEVAAGDFPGSALVHLRTVSRTLRAWTLPTEVAIPDSHSMITESGIRDSDLAERVHRLGAELVEYAGVATYPELRERTAVPKTDGETTHH